MEQAVSIEDIHLEQTEGPQPSFLEHRYTEPRYDVTVPHTSQHQGYSESRLPPQDLNEQDRPSVPLMSEISRIDSVHGLLKMRKFEGIDTDKPLRLLEFQHESF